MICSFGVLCVGVRSGLFASSDVGSPDTSLTPPEEDLEERLLQAYEDRASDGGVWFDYGGED